MYTQRIRKKRRLRGIALVELLVSLEIFGGLAALCVAIVICLHSKPNKPLPVASNQTTSVQTSSEAAESSIEAAPQLSIAEIKSEAAPLITICPRQDHFVHFETADSPK